MSKKNKKYMGQIKKMMRGLGWDGGKGWEKRRGGGDEGAFLLS